MAEVDASFDASSAAPSSSSQDSKALAAESTTDPMNHTVKVEDTAVDEVTVFQDRACVTRRLDIGEIPAGEHEITVLGVTEHLINPEGVVVKTNSGTILEVSVSSKEQRASSENSKKEKEKEEEDEEKKSLRRQLTAVEESLALVAREIDLVDSYATQTLSVGAAGTDHRAPIAADEAMKILGLHRERKEDLFKQRAELKDRETDLKKQLEKLGSLHEDKKGNDVTVCVNVEAKTKLVVFVTYHVKNAGWSACYDVRVDSKERTLQLSYHGLVKQNTGEDWNATRLTLSTATPNVAGNAPKLPQSHVSFRSAYRAPAKSKRKKGMFPGSQAMPTIGFNGAAYSDDEEEDSYGAGGLMRELAHRSRRLSSGTLREEMETAKIDTSSSACTAFSIERKTTIQSDNKPHKVGVAVLSLQTTFRLYAVPSKSEHAYLQALATNSTPYVLLQSDKVNLYVDGSFVGKTEIPNIAQNEKFHVFLGVSPGLSVTFTQPPIVRSSQRGLLSGKTWVFQHEARAILKNNTGRDVVIAVAMPYPRSNVDSIKVVLEEPDDSEVRTDKQVGQLCQTEGTLDRDEQHGGGLTGNPTPDYVTRNKFTNNLIFTRNIKEGESIVVAVRYKLEVPPNSQVDVVE